MKEKFRRFMYGRYGVDSFSRFLLGVCLLLFVLSRVFDSHFIYMLSTFVLIYDYFRMLSKNHYKRSAENQAFLNRTLKLRQWFEHQKYVLTQLKTHHIYTCPSCRQKIRIPRGKGKIEIRCPKCSTTFIKRS